MSFINMEGWIMSEHGVPESRLTVIKRAPDSIRENGSKIVMWWCECSCEKHTKIKVQSCSIRSGHTLSCGCIQKEKSCKRLKEQHKTNHYNLEGDYGIGYCSNTNREFYFDLEDYDKIKDYCWYESRLNKKYHLVEAHIANSNKSIKLHQLVFAPYCDHKDRNPFNNRKSNLRECTLQENARNSSIRIDNASGIIGVNMDKKRHMWRARIKTGEKDMHLGYFSDKRRAILARLCAEAKYFGKFAPQKDLFEEYNVYAHMTEFYKVTHPKSKSGVIGVILREDGLKWRSTIKVDGKILCIGTFVNMQDAILARLNAELKYFGKDNAPQKHLFEQYGINTAE